MKFFIKIVFILSLLFTLQGNAQNSLDILGLSSTNPAAVAYGLRKLSSDYTGNAIQVRRSLDNATLDIGFNGDGSIDSAAILTFVGIQDGYVSIWYDQSGNNRQLVKPDLSQQPRIISSGTFKYIGTKIAIDFSGNKGLVYSGSLNLASVAAVIRSESTNWPGYHCILDGTPRIGGILENDGTNFHSNVSPVAIWRNGISKLISSSLEPTNESMVLSITTSTDNLSQIFLGNYDGGSNGGSILQNEAIGFSTINTVGARQLLECNQGAYYGIPLTLCTTAILTNPSPLNRFECRGTVATPLSVEATGQNITFQWYSNTIPSIVGGTLIADATSATFIPPTVNNGTTYYYVVVSGSLGLPAVSLISGPVTVEELPSVTINPTSVTINAGDTATLTASGAITYSWSSVLYTPLDQVTTAKLAVGLRLLKSNYTGFAVRLRRASDNVEADFGFSGKNLDTAAIDSWLGVSAGYCVKLYDQSGNGNDMVAPSTSAQPLYVASGLNSKPILRFNTSQSI